MKGIVFTEFLELVESKFGYEMVDLIIQESHLPNGGAYTSIGTYPHSEIVTLVSHLSRRTEVPVPTLLRIFGKHLFGVFARTYGHFFKGITSSFQLLEHIENHIHIEVKKLYPDAELPKFIVTLHNETTLEMIYHSERRMADFAEGLIEATLEYFHETALVTQEDLNHEGSTVRFLIVKQTK